MKLGAERNKVIVLVVLSIIAAGTIYVQYFGSGPTVAPPRPPETKGPLAGQVIERATPRPRPVRAHGQSFRLPSFAGNSDEPLDPMKVDPTLRTDLLAKVRSVEFEGVERDLFQFTTRKVVAPPKPEMVAKAQDLLKKADPAPVKTDPPKPSKPKGPPIKWKYYGFANQPGDAQKRAFLLDGDEVFIATEGDVFNRRYKIVRIGINSIVVEDLQFNDQQTLPLDQS